MYELYDGMLSKLTMKIMNLKVPLNANEPTNLSTSS